MLLILSPSFYNILLYVFPFNSLRILNALFVIEIFVSMQLANIIEKASMLVVILSFVMPNSFFFFFSEMVAWGIQ